MLCFALLKFKYPVWLIFTVKLQNNSIFLQVYILDYVIFWRAEILGPKEHPCPEVTQVSFEGNGGSSLPCCRGKHVTMT